MGGPTVHSSDVVHQRSTVRTVGRAPLQVYSGNGSQLGGHEQGEVRRHNGCPMDLRATNGREERAEASSDTGSRAQSGSGTRHLHEKLRSLAWT